MFSKKQTFVNFQQSQISNKAAQHILGGAGAGSDSNCQRLEADLEAAIAVGDTARVRMLMGAIRRICGHPSRV
ncbi:hypothetical protein [uncultured Microscilla sp.]|uniref:hypothetical protein n=1 Tax=uncultured Microscilla sp. TaxID=432653 RepID=UPI0026148B0F|nr:hypothetical protein [uncultured Microscilla sp.]